MGHPVVGVAELQQIKQRPNTSIASKSLLESKMIRQDFRRIDPKRRATLDHKKKQFATPVFKQQDYPHRLNFYEIPPTDEITLEQFEQWAIDRLKGSSIYNPSIL